MNPFDKQIPDDIELQRIRTIVQEEVADIPTGGGGGSASRSKVFYEITITADLVFSFYAEHSGTVTKADGLTVLKRNNDLVTVPFAVTKNDILTGTAPDAGAYSMDLELADTAKPVNGFLGVEGSYNKGTSGYARCYQSIVFEMYGVSWGRNGLVNINNKILSTTENILNFYGQFDLMRIVSNDQYTAFVGPMKLTYVRNSDLFIDTITIGHSYNTIVNLKNNILLLNGYNIIVLIDLNTKSILFNVASSISMFSGDFSNQTAFFSSLNSWRSIRNGTLSSAYTLTGAFGVLCYSDFAYITGNNIIIKVNDATDQVVASLTLNGNARRILHIGTKLYCGTSTGWVYEIDIPTFAIARSVNTGIATGHDIVDIGGGYIILSSYDVNLAVRVKLSDFTWRSYAINVQPHRIHIDFPNGLIAFAKFASDATGLTNVYKLSNFLTP